jgi:hypothetical protein
VDSLPVTFVGLTEPTKDTSNAPAWGLSARGNIGVYCGVACGKFQPVIYAEPDLLCAVCVGVLLTLGEVSK